MIPNREFKLSELSLMNSSASEIDDAVEKAHSIPATNLLTNVVLNFSNPRDFGVTYDGTTDDRQFFQNCVNDLAAKGGGVIILDNGTMLFNTKSNIYQKEIIYIPSNILIAGKSWNSIVKVGDDIVDDSPLFLSKAETNIGFYGFTIDGNKSRMVMPSGSESEGINLKDCTYSHIWNMNIHDCGQEGIDLDDCSYITVKNSIIKDCYGNAIHGAGTNGCKLIHIDGVEVENCSYGRFTAGLTGVGAINLAGYGHTVENVNMKSVYIGLAMSVGYNDVVPTLFTKGNTYRNITISDYQKTAIFIEKDHMNIDFNDIVISSSSASESYAFSATATGLKNINIDNMRVSHDTIKSGIAISASNCTLNRINVNKATGGLILNGNNVNVSKSFLTNCSYGLKIVGSSCVVNTTNTEGSTSSILIQGSKNIVKDNFTSVAIVNTGTNNIVTDNILI